MKRLLLLIKPVSGNCNMRCQYCFYCDVVSSRGVQNSRTMSYKTLEILVRNALSETTEMCLFGFQGGEPTLAGLDFYRNLIRLEQKYNVNRVFIRHSIQTNGLLLNDEWGTFLAEYDFLTGISIDGPKSVHNTLRTDANGKKTHKQCIFATRLLSKHKAKYNILSVVTRQLATHPDQVYHFYKTQGFRHLQLVPCLDGLREARNSHLYSLDSKRYGDFLCRLFDLWYDDFVKDDYYSFRNFDNFIYMLAGYPPENCATSGACSVNPLIEADGSVYPCDFYALNRYRLGSVYTHSFHEMLSGGVAEEFVGASRSVHAECCKCEYGFICKGGCRRDREPPNGDRLELNYFCASYKQFFKHALPRMTDIAAHMRIERG